MNNPALKNIKKAKVEMQRQDEGLKKRKDITLREKLLKAGVIVSIDEYNSNFSAYLEDLLRKDLKRRKIDLSIY